MSTDLNRDYSIGPEIGRGRFGTVFRCYSAVDGAAYAVKSIDKSILTDPLDLDSISLEAKLTQLAAVGNPNAVNIHAVYEDDNHIHLVLDLCTGPDLFYKITTTAPFSEPEAAEILTSLMTAVSICHCRGIAHRDIKPENILFDDENTLKLLDFGSAGLFGCEEKMRGIYGTPYYVAPEVLSGREYTEKVDVWSCGVILYLLLSGILPFYGESASEVFEKVIRGNLRFPAGAFPEVSKEAKDLIRRMVCKDVGRRLSAEQVLRHPWITSRGGSARMESDLT